MDHRGPQIEENDLESHLSFVTSKTLARRVRYPRPTLMAAMCSGPTADPAGHPWMA